MVIYRIGSLEKPYEPPSVCSKVIYRIGSLEKTSNLILTPSLVIYRIGSLEREVLADKLDRAVIYPA